MALEGTLQTPIGKVPKKGAVIVGVGAVGVLGIVWYRSKQQASQASSSTDQTSQDQNIDPATGYPYGSPEDQAALQNMQAYSGQLGPVFDPGGGYTGGYDPYTGGFPGPGSYTSNAQWSQAAEDYLVNTVGDPAADVGNALGKYITGQALTSDQESFINQAIAFAGYPPVPGPDGFPPSMRNAPTTTGPPPTQSAVNPVKGLHVSARATQADIHWNASKGATSYRIRIRDTHGHIVKEETSTTTNTTVHDLPRHATLEANVLAEPAASGAKVAKARFHMR